MTKILNPKVKAAGIFDAFEMGILKTVAERTLTPVVGNSTLVSGAVKLVGGGALTAISKNKHVGLLSSAMVIDGVEDMSHVLIDRMFGSAEENTGGW